MLALMAAKLCRMLHSAGPGKAPPTCSSRVARNDQYLKLLSTCQAQELLPQNLGVSGLQRCLQHPWSITACVKAITVRWLAADKK